MINNRKKAKYLGLHEKGKLSKRVEKALQLLNTCTVCPHHCGVNRMEGELGLCRVGRKARVSGFGPHFGEESPLVGQNGSGTIFFEGCNLRCVFCQNYEISHIDKDGDKALEAADKSQLAQVMLNLQEQGCHNINFVTPSHVVPQILEALPLAIELGLHIPLIYNSSAYDSINSLKLLDGVVDIYMPDCKFWSNTLARQYTAAENYPEVMQEVLGEMYQQVGDLVLDEEGKAIAGLLVRHLVMPDHLEDTDEIVKFIAGRVSKDTYVNMMDQYHPCFKASNYVPINKELKPSEFEEAMHLARNAGLHRFEQRDWLAILKNLKH